jgi:hypothetical protein
VSLEISESWNSSHLQVHVHLIQSNYYVSLDMPFSDSVLGSGPSGLVISVAVVGVVRRRAVLMGVSRTVEPWWEKGVKCVL